MAQARWTAILSFANSVQTASWWSLNAAMLANPITWIIAGVIGLTALIGYLIYKVDGWGDAWSNTITGVKALWSGYMSFFKLGWLSAEHLILSGIDAISIAWYKLKGLWDEKGSKAGLNTINEQSELRKKAIRNEGLEIVKQGSIALDSFKKGFNSLSINDKSLADAKNEITSKLGISDPKKSTSVSTNLSNSKTSANKSKNTQAVTGGTKHNYITITLEQLIGVLNIKGNDFKDSAKQMQDAGTDALMRTLALAVTAGS
jgi:hypothetical protein